MIAKHSLIIGGHRTSVSLEPEFWTALHHQAATENVSINTLVTRIDTARNGNLSSAIRIYLFNAAKGARS